MNLLRTISGIDKQKNKKRIIIYARAKRAMQNELARFAGVETGGLLLGYAKAGSPVKVLEATDGGVNAVRGEHFFRYDEEYEEHICGIISEMYKPPLQIVGVWHKHNSACRTPFSRADENIHQQLVRQNPHPCVSVLFEKTFRRTGGRIRYRARIFLLEKSGAYTDAGSGKVWK